MSSSPRIYSDANPVIELAKKSLGLHDPARSLDLEYLERILHCRASATVAVETQHMSQRNGFYPRRLGYRCAM